MININKRIIIAVDGFSSCGKSTVAKSLASILNYGYVDTGAMYRAVTLYCMNNNFISEQAICEEKLKKELPNIKINFLYNNESERNETFLNNVNVEDKIRKIEVSNLVSIVSKISFVRAEMVRLQQAMGVDKGIVMDGRDIGTVVFPNAELKLFMTADPVIRAKRRLKELTCKGENVSFEDVFENLKNRDYIDQNREDSPLKKADDAIVIDNSYLSKEEQLNKIIEIINEKFCS